MNPTIRVVEAWHEALNAGDVNRLAALVHEDIEVREPRGSGHGVALMRDWVQRAGMQLKVQRMFLRDGEVVVAQSATWRSPDTGKVGNPQEVASAFSVHDGRVRRVIRYADVGSALESTELDERDELRPPKP